MAAPHERLAQRELHSILALRWEGDSDGVERVGPRIQHDIGGCRQQPCTEVPACRCNAGDGGENTTRVIIMDNASSGSVSVTVFQIFGAGGVEGEGLAGAEGLVGRRGEAGGGGAPDGDGGGSGGISAAASEGGPYAVGRGCCGTDVNLIHAGARGKGRAGTGSVCVPLVVCNGEVGISGEGDSLASADAGVLGGDGDATRRGGTGMSKLEGSVRQELAPVQIPQRVLPSEPFLMRRV